MHLHRCRTLLEQTRAELASGIHLTESIDGIIQGHSLKTVETSHVHSQERSTCRWCLQANARKLPRSRSAALGQTQSDPVC